MTQPTSQRDGNTPIPEPTAQEVRSLFERQPFGAHDVVFISSSDQDGDPIIVVEVKHRLVDQPLNLQEIFNADRAARDIAWRSGERRFLHVEHVYDPKQKVVEK